MFDTLLYSDFFNIITIAIGINLAYIIIDRKKTESVDQFAFFGFLSIMTDRVFSWVKTLYTKKLESKESTQTKIEYYCKTNKLSSETKGAFKLLSEDIDDIFKKLERVESGACRYISAGSRAKNLSKISLVCFLYGIFVLFLGGIQSKNSSIDIDSGLFFCNLAFLFMIIHCILWEKRTIKLWKESKKYEHSMICAWINKSFHLIGLILEPRFLTFLLTYVVVIIISLNIIFNEYTIVDGWYNSFFAGNNHWHIFITLLICFSGFVVYTIVVITLLSIVLIVFIIKLWSIDVRKEVKKIDDKIDRYKDELERIDEALLNDPPDKNRFA